MNCDHTFDQLTRPDGRHNAELQQHLRSCPRCRDLADMFDPALDLLADAAQSSSALGGSDSAIEPGRTRSNGPGSFGPDAISSALRSWNHSEAVLTAAAVRSGTFIDRGRIPTIGLRWGAGFAVAGALLLAVLIPGMPSQNGSNLQVVIPQHCYRIAADAPPVSAELAIAGCVACHSRLETLRDADEPSRELARTTVARCVNCHLDHSAAHLARSEPCLFELTRS